MGEGSVKRSYSLVKGAKITPLPAKQVRKPRGYTALGTLHWSSDSRVRPLLLSRAVAHAPAIQWMRVVLHGQVGSMLLLQLCESMQINILFPFLVFMVEDFGYKGEKLGLYAGESVRGCSPLRFRA